MEDDEEDVSYFPFFFARFFCFLALFFSRFFSLRFRFLSSAFSCAFSICATLSLSTRR